MKTLVLPLALATAALALAACGSAALQAGDVGRTDAAIRAAQEMNAAATPRAALHLHYAQEERTQADQLAHEGERERASMTMRRAEADANLAVALSREAAADRDARAATDALAQSSGGAR